MAAANALSKKNFAETTAEVDRLGKEKVRLERLAEKLARQLEETNSELKIVVRDELKRAGELDTMLRKALAGDLFKGKKAQEHRAALIGVVLAAMSNDGAEKKPAPADTIEDVPPAREEPRLSTPALATPLAPKNLSPDILGPVGSKPAVDGGDMDDQKNAEAA